MLISLERFEDAFFNTENRELSRVTKYSPSLFSKIKKGERSFNSFTLKDIISISELVEDKKHDYLDVVDFLDKIKRYTFYAKYNISFISHKKSTKIMGILKKDIENLTFRDIGTLADFYDSVKELRVTNEDVILDNFKKIKKSLGEPLYKKAIELGVCSNFFSLNKTVNSILNMPDFAVNIYADAFCNGNKALFINRLLYDSSL